MTPARFHWMPCMLLVAAGCGHSEAPTVGGDIETGFAFTNLSTDRYASLRIRAHASLESAPFFETALLAPGATQRERFLDAMGVACPASVDIRLLLYRRIRADVPIGLDPGEAVEADPDAAGALEGLPVCTGQPVETLTIVNWDAPAGTGKVKIAQGTPLEKVFADRGLFPDGDGAWVFDGVAGRPGDMAPAPHATAAIIRGRVVGANGTGARDIGVLLRTRFRVRLDDDDPTNDPDAGFGAPIAFVTTDQEGAFAFDRPAGVYRVEFFSDDFLFRPVTLDVESPAGPLVSVVEPR